jgi:hypothetical protein
MNDLAKRLREFDESLATFKAETRPSWQTGEIFNVLLAAAKESFPDDPVVQAISPAVRGKTVPGALGQAIATVDVGSMRAAVKQMVAITGGRRPSVAV